MMLSGTALGRALGVANPASEYCIAHGGQLEVREGPGGQYGMCKFPDGSECEEWAFARGECKPSGTGTGLFSGSGLAWFAAGSMVVLSTVIAMQRGAARKSRKRRN